MDQFLLDLRLALRRFRQNPGFVAVAVLTLTLGIGANTAIFSAINAILVRSLPVTRSSELVSLNERQGQDTFPTLSVPNYRDIRDRNNVLSGLVAYRLLPASLGLPGSSQRTWGYLVTGNYFEVLGVSARIGRLLQPSDDIKPGGHPVAVISYTLWQKQFEADPSLVGKTVKFNGQDFTILGVTPQGFFGTELYFSPEVYFPMAMQRELEGGSGYLDKRNTENTFVVGRLKPGVAMPHAEAALNVIAAQLGKEYPKDNEGMKIVLTPPGLAGNYIRGAVIGFALVLFAVSSLVLLVACVNLTSMLLARASDRRKETAIRLALGAGRMRLIRQLLTENLVVALAGGLGGALVALWISDALTGWRPPIDFPLTLNITPDARVFLFALLVSVLTTLLFGLAPALQTTRADLVPALKNEAASEKLRRWHLRDYVVGVQVALSTLLLVCSVLVVTSLQRAVDAPIGYNPKGAVTASFDLSMQHYDETRGREFQRRFLEKVRALPGIESAALTNWLPLSLNSSSDSVFVEGRPQPKATEAPIVYHFDVSPDFFRTMRSRVVAGREFDARDRLGSPQVAMVNQAFVRKVLAGDSPLGRRFRTGTVDGKPIEIVGVVEDGKYFSLNEDRKPAFWRPLEVVYSSNAALVARTKLRGPETLHMIESAAREIDPDVAIFSAGTMVEKLDLPLFPARIAAFALAAFGLLAAILAATGIYGVMAYSVSRRTREIGIRMAIGASQSQVLGMVARRSLLLIGAGTIAGLLAALAIGGLLGQILYGVEPHDPATFATVFCSMLLITAVACWIPARRAIRIDPVRALRQE
jgi:predicted permease